MKGGEALTTVSAVNPANIVAPDLFLALALLTIGIARDPHANGGDVVEFVEEVRGQKTRNFVFVFDPKGTDGVDTATWIKRWSDEDWLTANKSHPFAGFKAMAATYGNFAVWMKEHDPVLVFRNSLGGNLDSGRRERVAYVPSRLMGTDQGRRILQGAGL
jgi:hypothetical protein